MRALDRLRADGIRRLGTARSGFRYRTADGRRPARADLERIRALRLPPAWRDVHVAPQAGAKLQAVGTDAAGRVQYRYHPGFQRRRAEAKHRRLLRFQDPDQDEDEIQEERRPPPGGAVRTRPHAP